jgi:FixJ family two-component response regulator
VPGHVPKETEGTRVIIVTALSDKSTALRAPEKGAIDHISKPIPEYRLDSALHKAMEPRAHG